MNTDHLQRAIQLAQTHSADGRNGPFGAVVVRGEEVVGEGWNRVVENGDPTAHAEVVAIRAACQRLGTHELADCTLYTSCEPCPMCLAAIYWARIPEVVFACTKQDAAEAGFDDDFIYEEFEKQPADRTVRFIQAQRESGRAVLRRWIENPDKRPY